MSEQAPYTAPAPGAGPRTNTLAIIALIAGFVFPIAGIIIGHISLGQIKKTGEAGRGLALTGTIVGYVLSVGWIIFWIVYFVLIASLGTLGGYTY